VKITTLEEALSYICKLEQIIPKMEKRIQELEKENKGLNAKLLQYENSNTPPSMQRFRPANKHANNGKIGRPEGHEGSTRPVPKPDETIEVCVERCPKCRRILGEPLYLEKRIIEDIPKPQPARAVEYVLAHYKCKCGEEIAAKHPNCPSEGRFGPNIQSEVVLSNVQDRQPIRKIRNSMQRRYGIEISPATVLSFLHRAAECLEPEYDEIKENVRIADVVNADETSCPVNGDGWWLWVFLTGNETLFQISRRRNKEVIEGILGGYSHKRLIGSDGYSCYSDFGVRQRCNSHLIRKLKFHAEGNEKYLHFLEKLRDFYHVLKEKTSANPPPEERRKLYNWAVGWLWRFIATTRKYRELEKFSIYAENGMPEWFTFILHPEIEPTNNISERALREQVVRRKIFGTLRNEKGIIIYKVLSSVITTWKQRGYNVQDRLIAALSG